MREEGSGIRVIVTHASLLNDVVIKSKCKLSEQIDLLYDEISRCSNEDGSIPLDTYNKLVNELSSAIHLSSVDYNRIKSDDIKLNMKETI